MGRLLGWIGALLTLAYLAGLAWLTHGRWATIQELPLNELGDFLAGAFGPLAILWLVLGYFQQGIELRQNSRALNLQAEELRRSVEQQEELASSARETLEFQLQAAAKMEQLQRDNLKPIFVQQRTTCTANAAWSTEAKRTLYAHIVKVDVLNLGNRCSQVRVHSLSDDVKCSVSEQFVKPDSIFTITCRIPSGIKDVAALNLRIHCSDAAGNPFSEQLHVFPLGDNDRPYALILDSYHKQHRESIKENLVD
ncbi:hypothetical protein [Comamonas sp. GB3 AK4-5]|uniref:hypothetical protein n=1 Tax=Comamonas sp. GB3 AK4-5 TaxID=3231487 RepID=UPI00351DC3B9